MPSPEPIGVTLDPSGGTVPAGGYVQFTATTHYDDGHSTVQTVYDGSFGSFDNSVAAPARNTALFGRVYGIAAGTTTITFAMIGWPLSDTDHTAETTLTVTPAGPPAAPPTTRFSLAFAADTHEPYPAWTAIDAHPNLVTSYTIDRGRSYENDQTDAGHAAVTITDPDGILDPTNPAGPYYGQIRPLLHAVICRHDPVTDTWEARFRGYVEDYSYELDPSQRVNRLTVNLTDLFDVLAIAEMQPDQFGTNVNGQIQYPGGQRPDQRIARILMDAGLPTGMFVALPGAVQLQTSTYSPGESALTAVQDAADGEFPHVTSVYTDRRGRLCFHGRQARFDPAASATAAGADAWDYHDWQAGDGAAVHATPGTVQARALSFQQDVGKIINTATAMEVGAHDDAAPSRRVIDATSIARYGIRSWSETNLMTSRGDLTATYPTGAAVETKRFAQFMVANYKDPHNRMSSLEFRSLHPDDPRAPANWQLLSTVDIGDTIEVTVATAGGGGFTAEGYFVEGVHEDVKALRPGYDDVTVTLDLSPRSYYAVNPWATPLTSADPNLDADPTATRHHVKKTAHPAPKHHGRDHSHDGPDPVRHDWEDVGTGIDDGGGDVDLTGYIHYDSAGGPNHGNVLEVYTAAATGAGYGTHFDADDPPLAAVGIEGNASGGLAAHGQAIAVLAVTDGGAGTAVSAQALEDGGDAIRAYTTDGTGLYVQADNGTGVVIHVGAGATTALDILCAGTLYSVMLTLDHANGLKVQVGGDVFQVGGPGFATINGQRIWTDTYHPGV